MLSTISMAALVAETESLLQCSYPSHTTVGQHYVFRVIGLHNHAFLGCHAFDWLRELNDVLLGKVHFSQTALAVQAK